MNILALDTSTQQSSIAILADGKVLSFENATLKKTLSTSLMPIIDGCLKEAGLELNNLDGFAVGLGPGAFTSLRVGVATIKGLVFATGKPVVGISSLDLIAHNVKDLAQSITVMVDAKRKLIYTGQFEVQNGQLKRLGSYRLVSVDDVLASIKSDTLCVGDAIDVYKSELESFKKHKLTFAKPRAWLPDARILGSLGVEQLNGKNTNDEEALIPLYLYPENCQVRQ